MKYYKTLNEQGELVRLDKSTVKASGTEIDEVEYNMLKAVIEIEVNGEDANAVSERMA